MKKNLENKINKFLSERRVSEGGGWSQITPQDILDLRDIINSLIQEKCEEDADGDLPIEFELINRRTHERLQFDPIPYYGTLKSEDTPENLDWIQRLLMCNLEIATSKLSQFHKHQMFAREEERRQKKKDQK